VSAAPEIAVVVASHDRSLRLRWLLNALEEQTLDPARFEVVVAHDSAGLERLETEALLRAHPLAGAGVLRHLTFAPGRGPAAKRNAAWRASTAPVVAFTDDDCRPPAEWLERLLAATAAAPGAIVQGATRPDPDETNLVVVHGWRSQHVDPPGAWGQTCNIAYPRAILETTGGFDETLPVAAGEDTDLLQRALAAGSRLAAAPAALTFHAVEVQPLHRRLRAAGRWSHMAALVRRHPHLRAGFPLRVFWKERHAWLALALAGTALGRRFPPALLLVLPYARAAAPSYGPGRRGRARAIAELPLCALQDGAEIAALARGSVRHRTLVL
jgi:GT2 family glycosyltransferase